MTKKINFLLVLFSLVSLTGFGQIWIEDFDGGNTTNTISTSTQCNNNGNSYYGFVCENGGGCAIEITTTNSASYGLLMGNFLGGRDTDNSGGGCGPGDEEYATWDGIDISNFGVSDKLYLCFDIA